MNTNKTKAENIRIADIDDFENHPFRVKDDEDMTALMESIKANGVLSPVIVRPKENGRYEMISGHRRKHACELLGIDIIPATVTEMTKDEAIIRMVDSNCYRSVILPSEKAFAYKMKYDALKQSAGRPANNSCQVGANYRTDEYMSENTTDSARQIQRFIRLTNLIKPLLERVDDKEMAMGPAVELSYMDKDDQESVYDIMIDEEVSPSISQAKQLREMSAAGFDVDEAYDLLVQPKPNQTEKISFSYSKVGTLIPEGLTHQEAEDFVVKSIEFYKHYRQKQKSR